jgi:hypothetical protein
MYLSEQHITPVKLRRLHALQRQHPVGPFDPEAPMRRRS